MSILDIVIAIPLIWGAYKGFTKGFIIEILSFLALALGVTGAFKYAHIMASYLQSHFDINTVYLPFFSFLIVFVLIVILIFSLAKVLTKFINLIALGPFNKIAGMLFGFLKYAFIVSIILWLCSQANIIPPELKAHSFLFSYTQPLAPQTINLISHIIPGLDELIFSIDQMFEQLTEKQLLVHVSSAEFNQYLIQ